MSSISSSNKDRAMKTTLHTLARQLRYRWPALIGILRGRTVLYAAHIENGQVVLSNPNGAVLIGNVISGSPSNGIEVPIT